MKVVTEYAHHDPNFRRSSRNSSVSTRPVMPARQWHGHRSGRVPPTHHEKALVISRTLFCEADYRADWEEPMRRIIDDWGLRYPGAKHVEHAYFYEVGDRRSARAAGVVNRRR